MFKRPLFAAALFLAFTAYLLVTLWPGIFIPRISAEYGSTVIVKGRVYKIEDKEKHRYLFLKDALIDGSPCGSTLLVMKRSAGAETINTGNTILASGKLDEYETARNFGNYDEKKYYYSLGIFYRVQGIHSQVTDASINIPGHLMYLLRSRLTGVFEEAAGDGEGVFGTGSLAGIFSSISVGDRSGLSDTIGNIYRSGGIIHILAISGLHISILGMGLFRLIRRFTTFLPSALVSSACMIFYCIMCGFGVSVLRAVIMFLVSICGIGLGKTVDMLNSASIAAIIILSANPFFITNTGFVMSFTAVLSIAVTGRIFSLFTGGGAFIRAAASGMAVTVSLMPVTASNYYEIPTYSLLLNIIVIPLMKYILVSVLSGGLAGFLSIVISRFILGTGAFLLRFAEMLCILGSNLPFSTFVTGKPEAWRIILFYAALIAALAVMKKCKKIFGKHKRPIVRTAAILGLCLSLSLILLVRTRPDSLKIIFLDVGQGDCIVIKSPSGSIYMIDGGSTDIDSLAKYRLVSALKYEGISRIDCSVITHPDTDHMSGVIDILKNPSCGIEIKKVLIPFVPEDEKYRELLSVCADSNIEMEDAYSGVALDDGMIKIDFLYPDKGFCSDDTNDYSAVVKVSFGSFSALFTGDLPAEKEYLIKWPDLYEYDLLKVAHHGSRNATSEAFLNIVSPEIAVISAGVNNQYGHPHSETLHRLEQAGADIYCTAENGEIIVTVNINGEIRLETKL